MTPSIDLGDDDIDISQLVDALLALGNALRPVNDLMRLMHPDNPGVSQEVTGAARELAAACLIFILQTTGLDVRLITEGETE